MQSMHIFLPDEILFQIFTLCCPRDVVRARCASKQFYDISYDSEPWNILYRNAPLPRPPGPYPHQSRHFLERTLVQSAKLAQTWTAEPFQVISRKPIRMEQSECRSTPIVVGRWLLACEQQRRLVLHDIERTRRARRRVIWDLENAGQPKPGAQEKRSIIPFLRSKNHHPDVGRISSWSACSVISTEGELIYALVCVNTKIWKLLQFQVNGDGYPILRDSLSHPLRGDTFVHLKTENLLNSTLLYIDCLDSLFDPKTRNFYQFPTLGPEPVNSTVQMETVVKLPPSVSPRTMYDGIPLPLYASVEKAVFLTRTHVLFFYLGQRRVPVLRAFALPPDPHLSSCHTSTIMPRVTHECLIVADVPLSLSLVRNSVVDPLTGSTSIRFLHYSQQNHKLRISCVDLTLPKSPARSILPISVEIHDVFTVNLPVSPYRADMLLTTSDDGHARGFFQIYACLPGEPPEYYSIKFGIDASHDQCIPRVGKLGRADARSGDSQNITWFDGIAGKVGYERFRSDKFWGFVVDTLR